MPQGKSKRYRIVSDGTSMDTHVYDPDGKKMGLLKSLRLYIDADAKFLKVDMLQISNVKVGPGRAYSADLTEEVAPHRLELDVLIPEENAEIKKVPIEKLDGGNKNE